MRQVLVYARDDPLGSSHPVSSCGLLLEKAFYTEGGITAVCNLKVVCRQATCSCLGSHARRQHFGLHQSTECCLLLQLFSFKHHYGDNGSNCDCDCDCGLYWRWCYGGIALAAPKWSKALRVGCKAIEYTTQHSPRFLACQVFTIMKTGMLVRCWILEVATPRLAASRMVTIRMWDDGQQRFP